jgi:segregation and condensation protein A
MEISDIPIVEITRQYHEYLDLMRDLNLEVAGEYLVMAATLMHIKSQMLLPVEPSDEEEAVDPRADLVHQLLEHQRFKQAAENLQAIDSVRGLIWTRDGIVPSEFKGEELLAVDLFDLIGAFQKLLGRLDEEARLRLKRDDVSVADKISWIADLLEQRASVSLSELLETLATRIERIAVFLAVLEMVRLRLIVAFQRRMFGDVHIALRSQEPAEGSEIDRDARADEGEAR